MDPKTLLVSVGAAEACATLMFYWLARQDRSSGWMLWGHASAMRTLSSFVYSLLLDGAFGSFKWPAQFVSIWLTILSGAVSMHAVAAILGVPAPRWRQLVPIFLILVGHFYLAWVQVDPRWRVSFQSLALGYAMAWCALLVFRQGCGTSPMRSMFAWALSGWSVLQVLRAVMITFFSPDGSATPIAVAASQAWYYVAYEVAVIASAIALLNLRNSALHQELQAAYATAVALAETDGLTRLLNRRTVLARGERMVADALRQQTPVSVAMLDCDHFKRINDVHGHPAGDEVLARIGAVLDMLKPAGALAGRYGGEEFILVLPGTTALQAQKITSRILSAVRSIDVASARRTDPIAVTLSAGISNWTPDDRQTPLSTLVMWADEALLEAKARGRDRSVMQLPGAGGPGQRNATWECNPHHSRPMGL